MMSILTELKKKLRKMTNNQMLIKTNNRSFNKNLNLHKHHRDK